MIKKQYILMMLMAVLFAACAEDQTGGSLPESSSAITFSSKMGMQSRATSTDLEMYAKDFRVYGINGKVENSAWKTENTVMDNYIVWWNDNTAATSSTNSSDWEYVGSYTGSNGLGGTEATMRSDLNSEETTSIAQKQFIKYWDYGQPYHVFWAIAKASQGDGFSASTADATKGTVVSYTINNLSAPNGNSPSTCLFYTAPVVVEKSDYNKPVQLPFICFASRVRVGFYEVIPGYAVKDVMFYGADGNAITNETEKKNCTAKGGFVSHCGITISYTLGVPAGSTTSVGYNGTPTPGYTQQLGTLNYTYPDDNKLTGVTDNDKQYVAKVSSAPTYAGKVEWPGYYTYILPYPDNTQPLTLKCDYTLVSTDGSGQEINVKGATATVPSEYCKWQPNHSYTYLFKFTDDKLKPITFAAYGEVANTTDNQQGTITTVGDYSITTYQEGSTDAEGIQYKTGKDMEVMVVKHTDAGESQKIGLNGTTDYVVIYHQKTTKEWVVETTESESTDPSTDVYKEKLEYAGTTNGYENSKAHFIPDMPGTYRVEYWHKDEGAAAQKMAIKIVKIKGEEADTPLNEYDKWQSGTSGNAQW